VNQFVVAAVGAPPFGRVRNTAGGAHIAFYVGDR